MLRLSFIRKIIIPALKAHSGLLYSTKVGKPRSAAKLTLVSASLGVLVGAGYGGYTHYKVNVKRNHKVESEDYAFLASPPAYKPQYKVLNDTDPSNLHLVLFQYRTCPFCCKVRAYLDAKGISYEVVEVDAVLRQDIKWSGYKKVPILLVKVDGGYQQLIDSTAIMSVLETYLKEKNTNLPQVLKYYPVTKYVNEDGKNVTEIANKYFVMHNEAIKNEKVRQDEMEERKWREWADRELVHMLSPNVYRSPKEALDTFKWFEDVGGWRTSFPGWECNLMVYGGAIAMYFISKRLKKRHNIEDERNSLYKAANRWSTALKTRGTKYHGGDEPNLADISVYGVLSSIEGCGAFNDLRINTDIGSWFDAMKDYMNRSKGRLAVA